MAVPDENPGYKDAKEYSEDPVATPVVDRDHHEYSIGMDAFMLENIGALLALAGLITGIDPVIHIWNRTIDSDLTIPDNRSGLILGPTVIEEGVNIDIQGDSEIVFISVSTLAALEPQP